MKISELVSRCFAESTARGWWDDANSNDPKYVVGTKLVLIHGEISEAMEGYRKGLQDSHLPDRPAIEVELADALIRIGDLAGWLGLDLEGAVAEKMLYNRTRADHDKAVRDAAGGKKF